MVVTLELLAASAAGRFCNWLDNPHGGDHTRGCASMSSNGAKKVAAR
jgi:hypothetical protein